MLVPEITSNCIHYNQISTNVIISCPDVPLYINKDDNYSYIGNYFCCIHFLLKNTGNLLALNGVV